ncbi:hypothetical protein CAPTEDRAFT_196388 [Capitella teleta]|uniref:Uncharacterized protein n=1 Tax=Capitella teleta TaxID=283909 RepID=R7T7C9_CAPTE|nr:hypothetical protein CAPTEDRAFT_196388 [Capitella teleta]|eukprot:ELT89505.1 hypothetical protein CAPTEDRAFT_196388 [Capitella teleta]
MDPNHTSLLDYVLNEKKLEMLQSADVIEYLEKAQEKTQLEQRLQPTSSSEDQKPETVSTRIGSFVVKHGVMTFVGKEKETAAVPSAAAAKSEDESTELPLKARADIWSKENSAFTSVASRAAKNAE